MDMKLTLQGLAGTQSQLKAAQDAAEVFGNARLVVGSDLPYARWIEYGSIPEWQRVRQAGAADMAHIGLRAAWEATKGEVGRAVRRGSPAMRQALSLTVRRAANLAQVVTPVVSGRLRGSLYGKLETR